MTFFKKCKKINEIVLNLHNEIEKKLSCENLSIDELAEIVMAILKYPCLDDTNRMERMLGKIEKHIIELPSADFCLFMEKLKKNDIDNMKWNHLRFSDLIMEILLAWQVRYFCIKDFNKDHVKSASDVGKENCPCYPIVYRTDPQ